ncbi:hypothetical protein FCV25MIE_05272 [Fagus crenata]
MVVGGSGQETTATVKPVFRAPEIRKETITGNPGFQDVLRIMGPSKQRQPLRFFPDFASMTGDLFIKGGLTICLNDKGQQKVSWTPKEDKLKKAWVPCGPGPGLGKNKSKNEVLLGPKAHSTFEVGEPSNIAMEEAQFNAKPIESESGRGLDPLDFQRWKMSGDPRFFRFTVGFYKGRASLQPQRGDGLADSGRYDC